MSSARPLLPTCDVAVIGGGPAGATAATLVAQQGHRVQLFERETFPRYHVGESLIPETYWTFQRLGVLEKLRATAFTRKVSVQFVSAEGRESAPFDFESHKAHECSRTWQVVRSEFDRLLLENAREQGVLAHEGVRVRDVLFEGERAVGVRVEDASGELHDVQARVVVDASGQSAMLMNRLDLRVWDPVLNKGAIWAYYKGGRREEGRHEGATMVIQTPDRTGWFWYIPLNDDRVSVGVVKPFDELLRGGRPHEETFAEEIEACEAVRTRLEPAERITGVFATRDYSYRAREVAGDGWVMVGDAFGFLDPLYSSGVLIALRSGEWAADAINDGLASGDLSAAQLGCWQERFYRGLDRMRRLVCEFYDGFSFGRFVKTFPELGDSITDLLIGDMFEDKVDRVWQPMESLYPPGKTAPIAWDEGEAPAGAGTGNPSSVPDGPKL
jgi:flavin-dependent dehydrogenase